MKQYTLSSSTHGFSPIIIIAVIAALALLSAGGWFVWQKQHDNKQNANGQTSQSSDKKDEHKKDSKEQKPEDLYAHWQNYNNEAFGISFKYPAEWRIDELAYDPAASDTESQKTIKLRVDSDIKYGETVVIEVFGMTLDAAVEHWNEYYSQSGTFTSSTGMLKSKKSVQYVESDNGSKEYLFGVGAKTYKFRSINEEFHLMSDANYWDKFSKVFDSLTLK